MKRIWIVPVLVLNGWLSLAAAVEFQTLSLEQALQRAGEQKKVVFVDFFTDWCGPCKLMDASTWKDEQVGGWLAKNTVAIRLDGDRERPTLKKYAVTAFPTMLFIAPDGRVIDRMIGIRDAAGFLREAAAICSGDDPYVRAKRILKEEGEESPLARMKYVDRLNRLGRSEEALSALQWCYEKSMKGESIFVSRAKVIAEMGLLARTLPAAREALCSRLGQALPELDRESWTMAQLEDILEMSRHAGAVLSERLALYDRLKTHAEKGGRGKELAVLFQNELCEARRYAELVTLLELENAADSCLREIAVKQEWGRNNSDSPMYTASLRVIAALADTACGYYEILLGSGGEAKAALLAKKLLDLDPSAATLNGLARSGLFSGHPDRWHLELAERAWTLDENKGAGILDTFCRLLARFGQLPRAAALIREFQKGSGDETSNLKLEKCLDEARKGLSPSRT